MPARGGGFWSLARWPWVVLIKKRGNQGKRGGGGEMGAKMHNGMIQLERPRGVLPKSEGESW